MKGNCSWEKGIYQLHLDFKPYFVPCLGPAQHFAATYLMPYHACLPRRSSPGVPAPGAQPWSGRALSQTRVGTSEDAVPMASSPAFRGDAPKAVVQTLASPSWQSRAMLATRLQTDTPRL